MIELKLGQQMRDKVSGFTGIADARIEFMTGNVQYNLIRPVNKQGEPSDGLSFDQHQLESIKTVLEPIAPSSGGSIKLGQKVKDIVTGAQGIATLRTTFLNGCVYVSVVTPDAVGSPSTTLFTDAYRLERVSEGIVAKITKAVTSTEPGEKKPGGLSYKVPMRG